MTKTGFSASVTLGNHATAVVRDGWLIFTSEPEWFEHALPLEEAIPKLEFLLKATRLQRGG